MSKNWWQTWLHPQLLIYLSVKKRLLTWLAEMMMDSVCSMVDPCCSASVPESKLCRDIPCKIRINTWHRVFCVFPFWIDPPISVPHTCHNSMCLSVGRLECATWPSDSRFWCSCSLCKRHSHPKHRCSKSHHGSPFPPESLHTISQILAPGEWNSATVCNPGQRFWTKCNLQDYKCNGCVTLVSQMYAYKCIHKKKCCIIILERFVAIQATQYLESFNCLACWQRRWNSPCGDMPSSNL